MDATGSSVATVGLLITSLAFGEAVDQPGGLYTLCGLLLAALAGLSLITLGVWMGDNPTASRAVLAKSVAWLRQNLAVVGISIASSAVTAAVMPPGGLDGAPLVFYFGRLFLLLLVGVSLVMLSVCSRSGTATATASVVGLDS